jgi:GTP-binding protein lepA
MAVCVREKQAGSIVHWRMLAKPHSGFADPPLFFQTAPISRNGLFQLKCAAIKFIIPKYKDKGLEI